MSTLISYLPYDQAEFASGKAMMQGVGNAFSTFGWLPSGDGGAINTTGNYGSATITNVMIQNNLLQVTFSSPTNQFSPGAAILLTGLTTNTFLNNQIVRITDNLGSQNFVVSLASVATSVGSTAVYTTSTTYTNLPANFFAGVIFVVTGFTTSANNGTFVCTASAATTTSATTTLTLYTTAATNETHAATATQQPDRTNTVFTAFFTHADVNGTGGNVHDFSSPASDTGTAAIVYGYNTITGPLDNTNTNYTIKQPKKFRGGYVPVTPTFTQLQTTNNLTTLTFGTNGHGMDLTRSVGLGMRVTGVTAGTFTWLNDAAAPFNGNTNTYTSGWPIVSLTSTTIVINTSFSPRNDIAATPVTAGFAAPYYVGGNVDTTVSTNDMVLYNGDLYECTGLISGQTTLSQGGFFGFQGIGGGGGFATSSGNNFSSFVLSAAANASGGTTAYTGTITGGTTPANAYAGYVFTVTGFTNAANNGTFTCTASNTTTLTLNNTAGTAETHAGTATFQSGDGAIPGTNSSSWKRVVFETWMSNDTLSSTNKMYLRIGWGASYTSQFIPQLWFGWGTATDGSGNIVQNFGWGTSQVIATTAISTGASSYTGAALWECDFSGDSGSMRFILWRGFAASSSSPAVVFNIERSRDNSGNATDAYFTVCYSGGSVFNAQQTVLKNGTGGAGVLEFNATTTIKTISCGNAQAFNNSLPVLPVFPMIGFVANPMIGVVSFKGGDISEGGLITASLYGTQHTYLCSRQGSGAVGGPANFGAPGAGTGQNGVGIRWE